ncbi:HD-GYP domain-containing protein [Oryzifoliimicrobium ureilyticus]|uniref:HD-GYP domain-containing protein n=1 Tax=Oryzifoliimicrobium ureilyticus TaxID=3113724 RepID=UPI003075F984
MLKRIERRNAKLGMFIHDPHLPRLDRWVGGFLLTTNQDLERVQRSNLETVVIDTGLGMDVEDYRASTTAPTVWLQSESHIDLLGAAKARVRALFADARLGVSSFDEADSAVRAIYRSILADPTALIEMSRVKDDEDDLQRHSMAVSGLMMQFAEFLDLAPPTVQVLGVGGLLHDIGKIYLSSDILAKTAALTEEERNAIALHPQRGHDLLAQDPTMPELVLDICLHHHEKLNGAGYPHGLKAGEISLAVQIATLCDVYEALTSKRSYKPAWSSADALSSMSQTLDYFDEELFNQFRLFVKQTFFNQDTKNTAACL